LINSSFKRKVLLIAKREIEEKTDLNFRFEEIKEKQKVIKIKFLITTNEEKSIPFIPSSDIPQEILNTIPGKYRIAEVFQIIKPYLKREKMLISSIKYTRKNHNPDISWPWKKC